MKVSCLVKLFSEGPLPPTDWLHIGFVKVGDKEWSVVDRDGNVLGRCWGPPERRMFAFGESGRRGFHLRKLEDGEQFDVPLPAESVRAPCNGTDFPSAPPDVIERMDAEARREGTPGHIIGSTHHNRIQVEERKNKNRTPFARMTETFESMHQRRKLEKVRALREKLEKEEPK